MEGAASSLVMRRWTQPTLLQIQRQVVQRCAVTTQAFAANVERLQQQLQSSTDRRGELTQYGRRLFETEVLDDVETDCTPALAVKICQVAGQLRISPVKGQPFAAVVQACTSEAAVQAMDSASVARVMHTCLVLRSPKLYDVLFTYLRPLIGKANTLDAVAISVILNAYGRAGVHHDEFYETMCNAAAVSMKEARLPLAHIANVAHALSRVHYVHRPLLLVLREHALRQCAEASPIIAVTILDAFAELSFVDEETFNAYEQRLLEHVEQLQAPLLASLLSCLVTAGRGTPAVMETLGQRVVATIDAFDSDAIAKTCDAFYRANVLSEDVFGALAERACKVAAEFRADEVHKVLNALSAFDLFDAELFPLLSSRVVSMAKQGEFVSSADAAGVLASFAAVQERNEELTHVGTQIVASQMGGGVGAAGYINVLWACAVLSARNEAQMKLAEAVRADPRLLSFAPTRGASEEGVSERMRATLEERRAFVAKTLGISLTPASA